MATAPAPAPAPQTNFFTGFETFFGGLITSAEHGLSAVTPYVAPIESIIDDVAPIVTAFVPGGAAIETGIKTIEALAPNAGSSAQGLIADAKAEYAKVKDIIAPFEGLISQLLQMTRGPQGLVVLTPTTSAATAPSSAVAMSVPTPGKALS